jgi:hypothetical protein
MYLYYVQMSREKLKIQIKNKLKEINQIVTDMTAISHMVSGSFGVTYRKCGKPNCWCNDNESKGHPFTRITINKNQKSKTIAIPKKDRKWAEEMTRNYKTFRQHFQKLRLAEKTLNDLLNQFEDEAKNKTKGIRDFY